MSKRRNWTDEDVLADGLEDCDLDDYAILLVIAGDHQDINPER